LKYLNTFSILILLLVLSAFFVSCEDDEKNDPKEVISVTEADLIGCWEFQYYQENRYYKFAGDSVLFSSGEEPRTRFQSTWILNEDGTKLDLINQEHEIISFSENEIILKNIPLDEIDTLVRSDCPYGIDDDFILEKEDLIGCWEIFGSLGSLDYFQFTEDAWLTFLGEYAVSNSWTFSDSLLVMGENEGLPWKLILLENDVMKLQIDENEILLKRSDDCPEIIDEGISEEELIGCWYSSIEDEGRVIEMYYNFKEDGIFVRSINGDSQTENWSLSGDGKYISLKETDPPAMVKSYENGVLVLVMVEEGEGSYKISFERTEDCPQ